MAGLPPTELKVGARVVDLSGPILALPIPWHLEGALSLQSGLGCAGMIGMIMAWLVVGELVESRKMWWFSLACMFAGAPAAKAGRDQVLVTETEVRVRSWFGPWLLLDEAVAERSDLEAVAVIESQHPPGSYRMVLRFPEERWLAVLPEFFEDGAAAKARDTLAARLAVPAQGRVEASGAHDLLARLGRRGVRIRAANRLLTVVVLGSALAAGGPPWISGILVPVSWLVLGLAMARGVPIAAGSP